MTLVVLILIERELSVAISMCHLVRAVFVPGFVRILGGSVLM